MNGKLTLASIGDSTAFLVKNSNVIELTSEHNYSRLDEFKRVTDHYSPIFHIFSSNSGLRLNGQLEVSRSIGDLKYRPAVTSEAEIQTIGLSTLDQYLVLGSDGIYSKTFGKKQVTDFLIQSIKEGKNKEWISEQLVETAIRNGSQDNVTVTVVKLSDLYKNWLDTTSLPLRIRNGRHSLLNQNFSSGLFSAEKRETKKARHSLNFVTNSHLQKGMSCEEDRQRDS
mmetsp:Transcript_21152/g.23552  ORF Transcript_21152/g.23552 Transcript_21152/m.23552 type:complete len:226 (-) Transcript_21152:278-955(-)